ncbi:hypothetical protein Rsub_03794 [Raphidocelis subcapitata]|uniref:Elongation factor Tu, chloroplastic n=1 Tax=Raphidocelis subcapitata TaxID=307507 RepID=A0A2V0NUD5_9CHLO|nr:hypothetical protein Rsub_03794 [Raphidocelis subcapitata]|eukprot:GBF90939.1 hypothetical protein Rsub_03794 [Raphidocelis subcapitata]
MSRKGGSAYYDADDYDDYGGDDYADDWEEAYDAPVAAKPAPAKPKAPAAAAAKAKPPAAAKQGAFPVAPAAAAGGGFDFASPSPDDEARSSGPSERRAVGIPLAPSKTPTVKAAKEAQAATKAAAAQKAAAADANAGGSGDAAAAAIGGLSLKGGPSAAAAPAAAAGGGKQRRKLSEYVMEADLSRDVDAALAAELSGGAGQRSSLHLVVAGHVDAGKSTLMGRLLHELGLVSQKEAHKNLKEATQAGKASFSWAWVLDERPEERARGVTVDIAMARFATPRFNVTLLDAPGHRDFVPNMISGAAQADAALLVVDGSIGGFEAGFGAAASHGGGGGGAPTAGQTREHAQLIRSLGVEQVVVVITKLDTCGCSQERFDAIKAQLLPFLRSCGFKEASLQWLPAAAPSGQNLVAPPDDAKLAAWWRGPTLVQAIDAFVHHGRNAGLPLRLPIHDVTRTKAGALGVGGKVEAGALRVGSKVMLLPGGEVGAVKSIEVNGQPAQLARAGDSADVQLSGIEPTSAHAGAVLCHPAFPARVAMRVEARLLLLDVPMPILKGASVTVHCHTAREEGVVSALVALLDGKTGAELRQRPRCLLKGQTALVEITPARPMVLEEFGELRGLGRLALRDGGSTLAVGIVTRVLEEK